MNLIRESFAKHYCPRCDSRARRVRSSFGEYLLQYSVFVLLYVPAYLVIGFFVESFGGSEVLAWLLASLVAWTPVNLFYFRSSAFCCRSCGYVAQSSEVKNRGWSLIT